MVAIVLVVVVLVAIVEVLVPGVAGVALRARPVVGTGREGVFVKLLTDTSDHGTLGAAAELVITFSRGASCDGNTLREQSEIIGSLHIALALHILAVPFAGVHLRLSPLGVLLPPEALAPDGVG